MGLEPKQTKINVCAMSRLDLTFPSGSPKSQVGARDEGSGDAKLE